eukprot:1011500-Pleurochrysis_carterae.AAC.1
MRIALENTSMQTSHVLASARFRQPRPPVSSASFSSPNLQRRARLPPRPKASCRRWPALRRQAKR